MTRQELIDFIKESDKFYEGTDFVAHTDTEVQLIAVSIYNRMVHLTEKFRTKVNP